MFTGDGCCSLGGSRLLVAGSFPPHNYFAVPSHNRTGPAGSGSCVQEHPLAAGQFDLERTESGAHYRLKPTEPEVLGKVDYIGQIVIG